jgi:hypothetical protein
MPILLYVLRHRQFLESYLQFEGIEADRILWLHNQFEKEQIFRAMERLELSEREKVMEYEKWVKQKYLNNPNERKGKYLEAIVSGACSEIYHRHSIDYTDTVRFSNGIHDKGIDNTTDSCYIEAKNYNTNYWCDEAHPHIRDLPKEFEIAEKKLGYKFKHKTLIISNCITPTAVRWLEQDGWVITNIGKQVTDLDYSTYVRVKNIIVIKLREILSLPVDVTQR